jgi:glutaredoxin
MSENFNYLFYYLDSESIIIDKSEFLFQIQSHPDYPSLLSISDTLSFFNVENCAFPLIFADLEILPNRFIALINKGGNRKLCFVEIKNSKYYITEDKNTVEIKVFDLEEIWSGIVLLAEKPEMEAPQSKKNKFQLVFLIGFLIAILIIILKFEENYFLKLFFIFPVMGILISIAALKDLFGAESELINKFCNLTTSTSCESLVGSSKWKVFNYVNFSDLAIVFFFTQFFGLLIMMVNCTFMDFFAIQFGLLIASLPVILLSLYFQKFVEKKWCPLCLAIIATIILEFLYLMFTIDADSSFSLKSLILFLFVFSTTAFIWSYLKNILTNQKSLKEYQIKSNRFQRNYQIFKNTLIAKVKSELPLTPIVLGNKEASAVITIITNPFCSYCKEMHEIMERILYKNSNDLQIRLVIKVDLNSLDDDTKLFFRILMNIYFEEGAEQFRYKMGEWYGNKKIQSWLQKYRSKRFDSAKIDSIYNNLNIFCTNKGYIYTPAIYINDFEYPTAYERSNLEFFVKEIVEDYNF